MKRSDPNFLRKPTTFPKIMTSEHLTTDQNWLKTSKFNSYYVNADGT